MSYAEWLASHSDDLHLMFTKLCWISSAILNKKVTSAYEYHGGSTEPEPRHTFQEAHGACAVTHLGGTIMHKNQFLWVIHVSRISGRKSVLLLLLPPQLIQSLVER